MNRKAVDFTLAQIEPGSWEWRFQIGEAVTAGKTEAHLMGLAAHRVQQLIDRELQKPRNSPPKRQDNPG